MQELELDEAELRPSRETLCGNLCCGFQVGVSVSICLLGQHPVLHHACGW
jgi:hypothetical protein